jgi:hypothetical protein
MEKPAPAPRSCPHCGAEGVPRVVSIFSREIRVNVLPCKCAEREEVRRRERDLVRLARRHLEGNGLPPGVGEAWEALVPRQGQSEAHTALGAFIEEIAEAKTPRGERWGRTPRTRGCLSPPAPHVPAVFGPFGSGKTHLTASMATGLAERGVFVTYADVSTLLAEIRRGVWGEEGLATLEDDLACVPVLVLDDLGFSPLTDWGGEAVYGILNRRVGANLPTIVTTSVPADEMEARLSETYGRPILARIRQASAWVRIEAPQEIYQEDLDDRDLDRRTGDARLERLGEKEAG